MLRGQAAVLSSQRMVPTHTGDEKYDPQSVHISLFLSRFARSNRRSFLADQKAAIKFKYFNSSDDSAIVSWNPILS